jgi:hypothetical protein
MRVHVVDGLPSVAAGIEDNSVSGIGDALRQGDFVRLSRKLSEQSLVGGDGGQVTMVIPGNHQHMNRRLRTYVAECERPIAFDHDRSWHLA